jgi:hypothetical protein
LITPIQLYSLIKVLSQIPQAAIGVLTDVINILNITLPITMRMNAVDYMQSGTDGLDELQSSLLIEKGRRDRKAKCI